MINKKKMSNWLTDLTKNTTVSNIFGSYNSPLSKEWMPQVKIWRIKLITLVGLLFSFSSKVWGLLHHWRLWLPTSTRTASQRDEHSKLSVIWSYCEPFSVENGGETVFVCSQTPAAVFPISPVLFPTQIIWADVRSTWARTDKQSSPVLIMDIWNISCL